VKSLKVAEGSSHWSEYYKNIIGAKPPWERDTDSWTVKELNIQEIASKLKPKTVLDIGANTGWFSIMFANNGASVTSFERDEESINHLYSYVHREQVNVTPLATDIRQPSPEYELNIGTLSAATDRYKSELVMALAVIHHLVSNQRITLDHLAHILDKFTLKYLLIEFVPVNEYLYKLPGLTDENWNVPVIKEAFDQYYSYEGIWDSFPEGRKLLLFRKKNVE
jgi:SAM-dependent methyltransferase